MDIDFRDLDFPGWTRRLKQGLFQNLKSNSASPFNQLLQCLSDSLLPLLRCQLQDSQILTVGCPRAILSQFIVGDSKQHTGEQVFPPVSCVIVLQ